MAFDSGIISFTTKTNKVDLVDASHINAVQTELVTIETILGTGVKGNRADLKTRLNNALDADGSLLSGSSFPSPALPSQGFYRTDLDVLYVRNTSNTTWTPQGGSLSNVLFQYQGVVDGVAGLNQYAEVNSSSLNPAAPTTTFRFLAMDVNTVYRQVWTSRFVKISGINTVTVLSRIWVQSGGSNQANIKVDIGGLNNNVSGTAAQTTPEWVSFTIDVSSLTNGNIYTVTASIKNADGGASAQVFCSNIIGIGS